MIHWYRNSEKMTRGRGSLEIIFWKLPFVGILFDKIQFTHYSGEVENRLKECENSDVKLAEI